MKKGDMTMIIVKVTLDYATHTNFRQIFEFTAANIEVRESKVVYIQEGKYGSRRIPKANVAEMEYDSDYSMRESNADYGHLVIYCLEKDVDACKNKIKQDVLGVLTIRRDKHDMALKFLGEKFNAV
jgi:hypothetical protein